jgi:hypothetical protein
MALKAVDFRVPAVVQWVHWIQLMNLVQDFFPVQNHILSTGGDALSVYIYIYI